jgi:hypothetical protein
MALITRSLALHGTFAPSAVNFLQQIPENALFNKAHRLRHPDSIYKLSLGKIADAFCQVAEEYLSKSEEYRSSSSTSFQIDQLLKEQVNLLRALQEHFDELWLVLKALIDPAAAIKHGEYNDKYVIENKLPGAKSFQEAIGDYKKTLQIANKLKHQQCYLRGVAVWHHSSVHLGYCLEELDANGIFGPSPDIHPDQGAFSFARDLKWHLANVYLCSEKLVKAVTRALNTRGISINAQKTENDKKWEKIIALALKIPPAYFPKETRKPLAGFRFDDDLQTLTIKLPEHMRLQLPHPIKAVYSFIPDRYGTATKVPIP